MSRTRLIAWAFIVPILLLHFVVKISPSVSAVYYSMTEWSGIGTAEFVGLENFRKLLFEDRAFWQAFWHNWLWLSFSVFTFVMAMLAATLLAFISKGSLTFRTLLFIPYILPSVVVAGIWRNLLNPDLGIGAQLAAIGIPGLDIAFLGIPETSLAAVFFIDNWRWWVFLMLLLLAALQNISIELYESARARPGSHAPSTSTTSRKRGSGAVLHAPSPTPCCWWWAASPGFWCWADRPPTACPSWICRAGR